MNTIKQIADIAHCGGLAGLTEADALTAIRRLSLKYWDTTRNTEQMTQDTIDAVRSSSEVARQMREGKS